MLISCVSAKSKYRGEAVKSISLTPMANMNFAGESVLTFTEKSRSVCCATPYFQLILSLLKVPMIELEKMTAQIMIRIIEQKPPVRVRYYGYSRYLK